MDEPIGLLEDTDDHFILFTMDAASRDTVIADPEILPTVEATSERQTITQTLLSNDASPQQQIKALQTELDEAREKLHKADLAWIRQDADIYDLQDKLIAKEQELKREIRNADAGIEFRGVVDASFFKQKLDIIAKQEETIKEQAGMIEFLDDFAEKYVAKWVECNNATPKKDAFEVLGRKIEQLDEQSSSSTEGTAQSERKKVRGKTIEPLDEQSSSSTEGTAQSERKRVRGKKIEQLDEQSSSSGEDTAQSEPKKVEHLERIILRQAKELKTLKQNLATIQAVSDKPPVRRKRGPKQLHDDSIKQSAPISRWLVSTSGSEAIAESATCSKSDEIKKLDPGIVESDDENAPEAHGTISPMDWTTDDGTTAK